jgi:casein kinase 1
MKLNNGRGWEYKPYASQHHPHATGQMQNASTRDIHGTPARQPSRPGITADRLNAAQPPPPSPAKPGVGKTRDRQSGSGGLQGKRQSALGQEISTPTASTQAQFQNSNANLPGRIATPNQATTNAQQQSGLQGANEPEPTFVQKAMRALCCGTGRKS